MAKYVNNEKPAEPTKSANASLASTSSQGISSSAQAEPGDVDLNGLDEEQELDDDLLWGEVDTEEEEIDQLRMAAAHEVASSTVMDIEESEGVSLQAPGLDFLSDSPISGTLTNQVNGVKPKELKRINSKEPKVFDIQF